MSLNTRSGFTLIEILVVLVIISIVTTVALVSLSMNQSRHLENYANDLSQTITLAEEQAMLRPAVLGLQIKHQTYFFAIYNPDANVEKKEPQWTPIENSHSLGLHDIPDNIDIQIAVDGTPIVADEDSETEGPQIILSTNGDMTPFTIYVGKKGEKPRFLIRGEADGSIKNEKLS